MIRLTVRKQLRRYLLLAWLVSVLFMLVARLLGLQGIPLVLFVGATSGGFIWGLLDFWLREENICVNQRKAPGTKAHRT
jgi:membrane protease YdiL (CAAX protease family)